VGDGWRLEEIMGETRKPGRNPRQGITAKAAKFKPRKPAASWKGEKPRPPAKRRQK
jgi:hypothetical protein